MGGVIDVLPQNTSKQEQAGRRCWNEEPRGKEKKARRITRKRKEWL